MRRPDASETPPTDRQGLGKLATAKVASSTSTLPLSTASSFVNAVTGAVLVDLRDAKQDYLYRRVASLPSAPNGVTVILIVGCLAVDDKTVRLIRDEIPRISVHVLGEPLACGRWVEALRTGDTLAGFL